MATASQKGWIYNDQPAILNYLLEQEDDSENEGCLYRVYNLNDSYKINQKFVQLEGLFKEEYAKRAKYFEGIDEEEARQSFAISLSALLQINPDILSIELTADKSIFYTFKKDDFTFFIQHFFGFDEDDEGSDEAIISGFKGKNKLPSYAGTLYDTITELNSYVLLPANTINIDSPLYELSK